MPKQIQVKDIQITGGFWGAMLDQNAQTAIFHQWEQLEQSGSIENFRIAAGDSEHFRTGFFFADSDVYKWMDAASRIALHRPSGELKTRLDTLTKLIRKAQQPDGYLFTYNQIHFPGERWIALQIEHELYCHGHLIEGCLAHDLTYPDEDMLSVAIRAADLICDKFLDQPAHLQPGHQEIELALLSLYERTDNNRYLEMARQFLHRRGRVRGHGWRLLGATIRSGLRGQHVSRQEKVHRAAHPDQTPFELPPMNEAASSPLISLRFMANSISGKYFQTHKPVPEQGEAVGHSVRFGYTMAAETRLQRLDTPDPAVLAAQEALWQQMVTQRMYVTGGLGSLPVIEGFGRDAELDPKLAYAETCATIASLLWDWELLLNTGEACYADLFEWQLYNAALVGLGLDGQCYLYNNPLAADGELTREPWFRVPCCPSNISRTLAALGGQIYTYDADTLTLQHYISNRMEEKTPAPIAVTVKSGFPYDTQATITVLRAAPEARLRLRIPGWAADVQIRVNDDPVVVKLDPMAPAPTAGGYSPFGGQYVTLRGPIHAGDRIDIVFAPEVWPLQAAPEVGLGEQNTAFTYGPLVYCAEDLDNSNLDLDEVRLAPHSFSAAPAKSFPGVNELQGLDADGNPVRLIPYYAWANRGRSKMRVFFKHT
ncbi:glycoside hydrolase family 127 protein [bacterium]|nr:glycoside hydrolase family 127 protein [bacterium]